MSWQRCTETLLLWKSGEGLLFVNQTGRRVGAKVNYNVTWFPASETKGATWRLNVTRKECLRGDNREGHWTANLENITLAIISTIYCVILSDLNKQESSSGVSGQRQVGKSLRKLNREIKRTSGEGQRLISGATPASTPVPTTAGHRAAED